MATVKPVLILGAGASIDAGLPSSLALTRKVHEFLNSRHPSEAQLFAYIVSKLIVRNVRQGQSPFSPVDIETAYDAVKNFLNRDRHILSEFASGWDTTLGPTEAPLRFEISEFRHNLENLVRAGRTRSLNNPASADIRINRDAVYRISRQLEKSFGTTSANSYNISIYLEALSHLLTPDTPSFSYIEKLCEHTSNYFDCIATLNYDLTIENSCDHRGISYDYGLKNWNLRRYVKYQDSEVNLIKLHGSLNWYFKNEDDIEIGKDHKGSGRRGIVFGGQSEKLFSDGPFLALRQYFFDRARQSNVLIICGYSFSDNHINAMIRSWAATRRKSKMIVVNPNLDEKALTVFSKCQRPGADGKLKNFVQLRLFERGFAEVIDDVLNESISPVDLENSSYNQDLVHRLKSTGDLSEWARRQQ